MNQIAAHGLSITPHAASHLSWLGRELDNRAGSNWRKMSTAAADFVQLNGRKARQV
jgi:hypothetical protein